MTQIVPICICAGEESGDTLGAELIDALSQQDSVKYQISAMGGAKMRAAGAEIIVDSTNMGIVGIVEVIKHAGSVIRCMRTIKQHLRDKKPKCIILIDYPGMNLRFAKYAHDLGIKVLFYVSPQIWAWKRGRIKQMQRNIDHIAVLLPFEEKIYKQAGIPVTFVGHPLIASSKPRRDKEQCYQELNLDANKQTIAILPGSRQQEIQRLMPEIISSVNKLNNRIQNLQFILIKANSINESDLQIDRQVIKVTSDLQAALSIADTAICTSGTATLEVALYSVPLVIIYKLSAITYLLAKILVKVKFIGLCNIVAESEIAQELVQHDANADKISKEVDRLLNDKQYRADKLDALEKLRHNLNNGGGSAAVAEIVNHLTSNSGQ
jgi:lipid-A-disaccharide synthase